MSSERKPPPAPPPHRRASFGIQPGSRNRGFGSSDPERQRETETPAPAERVATPSGGKRQSAAQDVPGAASRRRGRGEDDTRPHR